MKNTIHPQYNEIQAKCSCGTTLALRSTATEDLHLDICSSCHPFYTGKQRDIDTGGRVDMFKKRFGALKSH